MKKIYYFLIDIFNTQKRFNKKYETYLGKFKKSYLDRSKAEKILVSCLIKLEFLSSKDSRSLGAAEAVLIMENYIDPSEKFTFNEIEETFLVMTFKRKEEYREYIIRRIKEYLTDNNVL
jgi:hypothetical protein